MKCKATSGAAAQSADATAGSPLPHSPIDLSAMLSVHPAPYFQKIAMRYRLDDFNLLTRYLIASSSNEHFLFSPSPCRSHVLSPFFLSLRWDISFVLWAILCVHNRADKTRSPRVDNCINYLNSDDGSPHERSPSLHDIYQLSSQWRHPRKLYCNIFPSFTFMRI